MSGEKSCKRLEEFVSQDPNLIMTICDNIINGSSLTSLSKVWEVKYSDLYRWVVSDEDRNELYQRALEQKKDFLSSRIIDELKNIGFADLRTAYDDNFNLKPVSEWPDELASIIGSLKRTDTGIEIKANDKMKALEMMGKEMSMFSNKVEHSGKLSLEELVSSSMPDDLKEQKVNEEKKEEDAVESKPEESNKEHTDMEI